MTPSTNEETDIETTDTTLTLRRRFDAPRERVWAAFTDPGELERWFVPDGMTADVHTHELEPGGTLSITWTDGETSIANEGHYLEVVEHERLVSGEETEDGQLRLTYEFRDVDDGTEVIVTQEFPGAVPDGADEGWASILDNLPAVLAPQPTKIVTDATTLTIRRTFDAPRARVWQAWTDPAELSEWWGPEGYTLPHCEVDLEPGGTWHFCMQSPAGDEYWCKGVYREVIEPERLVYVDSFSDEDGTLVDPTEFGMSEGFPVEALVTVRFEEHDGMTRVTVDYDAGTAAEAEREDVRAGFTESLDRLADVLGDARDDDSDDRAEVAE